VTMICLAAGAVIVPLMGDAITLAWMHSVEKVLWEEDWRSGPQGLSMTEARVRGSGAGMEPPPDARFVGGAWAWKPQVPPQSEIILRRSGATADWRVCVSGRCRPMSDYVPPEADPVVMKVCQGP
jgi:hypothetical protein